MTRNLEGKRIFVVEDDVTNMAVFSMILKQDGAVAIQDPWNDSTLSLLKKHLPVDVILLDLMLKHGVSGYQIADAIHAVPELSHIPIVAVSASDPAIEIPRAQAHGFSGYICKPISLALFPDQVASCIAGEPVWAPD
jgi:CheY-like chemotaxis protein